MERADVLIVGGGPAGSVCATALVAAGKDVLVVDAAPFPRDKPCAGWITPEAVGELSFPLDEYAVGHTLQPISGFRVGRIGGRAVTVDYGRPVSFGIRRCEMDAELLRRSRARVLAGERVAAVERRSGTWVLNGRLSAPVLVGAGGHFCPVARHLAGRVEPSAVVATREIEYRLEGGAAERCRVEEERPELYFSRDLRGYGWCFRKGRYLNVGLGRRDPRQLGRHVDEFLAFLQAEGRIEAPPAAGWRGHAYTVRDGARPRLVGDGVLLVGDAASLASPESGEGILPALVSGRLAAETILAAEGDWSEAALGGYGERLDERLGPPGRSRHLPAAVSGVLGAALLASSFFVRRVVLDRWFLHRSSPDHSRGRVSFRGNDPL